MVFAKVGHVMAPRWHKLAPRCTPKLPELDLDLHFEAIRWDVAPMLAYLARLVGSKSQSPSISGSPGAQ